MNFKIENTFKKNILKMSGYIGGEQSNNKMIRLNTNENPYPIPNVISEAIKEEIDKNELSLYPNESSYNARNAASKVFNVGRPEQILFDNGSSSILSMIFRDILEEGDSVAVVAPTFGLYEELVNIENAKLDKIPFLQDFKLPVIDLLESKAKMIIIVNPNAPIGTKNEFKDILKIIENTNKLVLLDEAYADFANINSVDLVKKYDNLIILRNFFKISIISRFKSRICYIFKRKYL